MIRNTLVINGDVINTEHCAINTLGKWYGHAWIDGSAIQVDSLEEGYDSKDTAEEAAFHAIRTRLGNIEDTKEAVIQTAPGTESNDIDPGTESNDIDSIDAIMRLESSETVGEDEFIRLFASLIRSGKAWQLQGWYGRTASSLIRDGLIDSKGNIL